MQILSAARPCEFTVLANQTAIHAIPAALNAMSTALLKAVTGNENARLSITNFPLPTLPGEAAIKQSRQQGERALSLAPVVSHRSTHNASQ